MTLFENAFKKYYSYLNEKMVHVHDGQIDQDDVGEEIDTEDIFDQVDELERNATINILRGKDLRMVYLNEEGEVVAAMYMEEGPDEFSFDIIVAEDYQGQGIGSRMLDAAIQEFNYLKDDNDEMEIRLDVVNELMKKALEKRGFEVKEDNNGRWIMGLPEEDPVDGGEADGEKPEEPEEDKGKEEITESVIF